VALVAVGVDVGPAGWRTLAGVRHRVRAVLSEPLGSRVFVDRHGNAAQRSERLVPAELGDRVAQRAEIETGGVNVLSGDRQRQ